MRPGDRVEVAPAAGSSLIGARGRVESVAPDGGLMVVLDDDPRPLRFGVRELIPLGSEPRHIGGAE